MNEILGLIGLLVFFAGLHLLWQSRHEIAYWVETYFRLLRRSLRKTSATTTASAGVHDHKPQERHTLRLVGGVGLVFLSQILLILGFLFDR